MRTLTSTTLASMMLASAFGLTLACGGSGGSDGGGGMGGSDESGGSSSGGSSSGGSSTGGSSSESFTDLSGRIRFANFISDGEAGVDVDVYWGNPLANYEFFASVPYGTVSEFATPRHDEENVVLDADEARYYVMPAGATEFEDMLASGDEVFAEETQLTAALAMARADVGVPGAILTQIFEEHELSLPPEGFSHVYAWAAAWAPIDEFSFAVVGSGDLCEPDDGEVTGGNIGTPALIPEGATGVTLFDANTECASGVPAPDGTIEVGHSYVLMGEAETYDLEQRSLLLLEVGGD